MSSRPVRVGLMPTPEIVSVACADRAGDHEERGRREIARHFQRARLETLRRRQADFAVRRVDAAAEAEQHALGVIARDGRLDHGRLALRVETGEQHRGLDLRAGDGQLVADAAQACAAADPHRRLARCRFDARAHLAQRRRDALHRPLHQRRVADQLAVEALSGQQARHQAHRGTGIAHVERMRRRLEPGTTDAAHADLARMVCSICTPSARIARIVARQSSLSRNPRTSVVPSAMPPSMTARCEIDLSPGTRMRARNVAGRRDEILGHGQQRLFERRQHALVLFARSDRDPQVIRQPVVADRPHDHALAQHRFVHRRRRPAAVDQHEIAGRRQLTHAECIEARAQLRHAGAIGLDRSLQVLAVVERGERRGERDRIDIERLAHAIEHVGDRRMRQRVADAQSRQAVGLRERARDEQVRKLAEPAARVGKVRLAHVFDVRLVHDHQRLLRHRRDEAPQRIGTTQVPVGLFGLATNTSRVRSLMSCAMAARSWPSGMAWPAGFAGAIAGRRTGRLHGDRIDREGVLRIDGFALRREERFRDQHEHVVRAVAERDAIGAAAVLARERLLQFETAAVGIEADLPRRLRDRLERPRPGPERILVGRELDAVADAVLALQLLERLAGNVRRERANAGGSELGGIDGHAAHSTAHGYDPSTLNSDDCFFSSSSAVLNGCWSAWPTTSMKNT